MPNQLFALIIGSVLIAGAITAWIITQTASAAAIPVIMAAILALRLYLGRQNP